ncbi:MAG: hypothetical protein M1840_003732 [Geoglossum simile]|nr:MAG: hypothetical protein M1840_003732 [Geoglossum simile]
MPICNLPPELLAEILRFTDPSTFYILTQSVAPLFAAAASSRSLLLWQLEALPGLKYGLEDLTFQELRSCFQERAARSLCGIGALAHITLFDFGLLNFNVRQSMIYPQFNGTDCLFMVHRDEPCPPRFRTVVDLSEQYDLADFRKISIVKIAVSPYGRRWAVLYNYEAVASSSYGRHRNGFFYSHETVEAEVPTTFMAERMKIWNEISWPQHNFRVAIANQENDMYHLMLDSPNSPGRGHYGAVGFGISDDDHAAICWRFVTSRFQWSEAWILQARTHVRREFRGPRSQNGPCESLAKVTHQSGVIRKPYDKQHLIQEILFSPDNGYLLLFSPISSVHSMYLEYLQGTGDCSIELNKTWVSIPDRIGYSKELNIGLPFFVSHTTDGTDCTVMWLSVGAMTFRSTGDAYIVRAIRTLQSQECDCQPSLASGTQQFDWEMMVRLEGFMRSRSSLGPIAAISKDSRRLVVADWNTIRLWPLDPEGLIENDIDHYLGGNRQSDLGIDHGIGCIDPLELPTNGDVIHKLYFASNDLLYAVTDHGLTAWDLGQHAGGRPTTEQPPRKTPPHNPGIPRSVETPARNCAIFRD